jgi:hypothetical protein
MVRHDPRPVKITFGDMRAAGVIGIVVSCQDYRCSHAIAMLADHWPDDVQAVRH